VHQTVSRVISVAVDALGQERFDLVCAFEVLEHIEDDAAAVKTRQQ